MEIVDNDPLSFGCKKDKAYEQKYHRDARNVLFRLMLDDKI